MENFAGGDLKILLCTNIVESGLDIQNANTIIIQDVQQFGLAQLYQVLLVPFTTFWALLRCVYLVMVIEMSTKADCDSIKKHIFNELERLVAHYLHT